MKTIEFELTMPQNNSWNGKWSGEGTKHLLYKRVKENKLKEILNKDSWYYNFGDGWSAAIYARILKPGERKQKSSGFCGYNWMVDSILEKGVIEPTPIK